jgi:Family of unknown function (DUF5330)
MFFLLRIAFWLGIVLILLPGSSTHRAPAADQVGASDAISAASATVKDLRGFCTREPNACAVGSRMATAIAYKAQAGAKMLYDFLNEALAPPAPSAPPETASRAGGARRAISKPVPDKSTLERASQNTLTPADLAPAWRGPPRGNGGNRSI